MHWRALLLTFCIVVLLVNLSEAAKKGGGRRKTKHRTKSSHRMIFVNPKRKEYYNNENVQLMPQSAIVKSTEEYQINQCPTQRYVLTQGARIVKASHFDYEFLLGHKISFICAAKGDPRPRITWFKDGIELHAHPYLQITEWHKSHDHIKSKLEITPARQMDSGTYDCEANNKYSIDRRSFKADFGTLSK
ncbi:UNVERIFIED_CONTAM: oig-4 [Trichonephila clavipes]